MRRSALALGATVVALALSAGPAAAESADQTVTDSTGAAQAGPTEVNAPIRVLSDGSDPAPSATVGAPQTADGSDGTAQAGTTEVNAPVRVLSDGQNAPSGGSTSGEQTASDSTGAQAGSAGASAPVRVASDGDNTSSGSAGGGEQTTTGSSGSAQVGQLGAEAPIRVASDGDDSGGSGGSTAGQSTSGSDGSAQIASPSVSAPIRVASEGDNDVAVDAEGGPVGDDGGTGALGGPVAGIDPLDDTTPATDVIEDGDGSSTSALLRPATSFIAAQAGELPLTGLGVGVLLLAGLLLLSSGTALRRGSGATG